MARDPTYTSLPDRWGVLPLDQEEEIYWELRLPKDTAAGAPLSSIKTPSASIETTEAEEAEEQDYVFDLGAAVGETGEEEREAKAPAKPPEPSNVPKRALLVMGAFASLRWLDCLADRLAAEGFEVCSYNHRGLPHGSYVDLSGLSESSDDGARSRSSSCESTATTTSSASSSSSSSSKRALSHHHTCELLAEDAWRLVAHVWGEADRGPIHIYGASMGGMVAMQMTVLDLRRADAERRPPRVASLFLAVTCRGVYPFPGMNDIARRVMPPLYKTGLIRLALPFLISRSKERMLQHLLSKCFRSEYLDSPHEETGEPMRAVWERAWAENFDDWSTFSCPEACANQLMTIASFYLSDEDAARLRKRVGTITVQIATHDVIVPSFMQEALANLVGARKLYVAGGHMLDTVETERFWRDTMEHFEEAAGEGRWGCGGWCS